MKQRSKVINKVRIISGKWRSRKISFPDSAGLRPTSDRTRETLFNWVQDFLPGVSCLDLFAGSGALGIEALSRGAAHVTFVDNTKLAIDSLETNLRSLQASGFQLIFADAQKWLIDSANKADRKYGLVFLDPPFAQDYLLKSCRLLEKTNCLGSGAHIYLESSSVIVQKDIPENWNIIKTKRAGAVYYILCKRLAAE